MTGYTLTSQLINLITLCNKDLKLDTNDTNRLKAINTMQAKLTTLALIIENQLIHLNKMEADIQAKQKEVKP